MNSDSGYEKMGIQMGQMGESYFGDGRLSGSIPESKIPVEYVHGPQNSVTSAHFVSWLMLFKSIQWLTVT